MLVQPECKGHKSWIQKPLLKKLDSLLHTFNMFKYLLQRPVQLQMLKE